jgi:energy-coupling factor transporter ATP-binding protein EcfA2
MATYFCNCGSNIENYDLCIKHKVAGFPSSGYQSQDLIYLIVKINKFWKLGAKGYLKEKTNEKPWEDAEIYKSAFKIDWEIIDPVNITAGLQKIYPPNFGLAIQGKKDLDNFQGKGDELKNYFDAFFTYDSIKISTPEINIPIETKSTKNPMRITPKELINHVDKYIAAKGFRYKYDEIANFYLSLRTKPFVILAGISGTGKTQLPRKFAASLGFDEIQLRQVPVRPDWTDSSDLLGYTALDGNFIQKELTLAIFEANKHPNKPFFFILDEMNLARVEHYFSDYLSIIETRERVKGKIKTEPILSKEMLKNATNSSELSAIWIPENLYLIGTVNMDETTHTFSRKVLDRANTIEMNDINLDWIQIPSSNIESLKEISNDLFVTEFIESKDLSVSDKKSIENEIELLKKINDILTKADLQFGYRVRDEIAFYLILNKKYKLIEDDSAIDFQLTQKILPRIHGSSERVQTLLIELLNLLESKSFKINSEIADIVSAMKDDKLKYSRASKKIIFMLKRFDDDRFTSFWL